MRLFPFVRPALSHLLLVGFACGAIGTRDALADVSVEVRTPDDYLELSDPSFARVDAAQAFAEASISSGIFRDFADADGGTLAPDSLVRATSQLRTFRLTNDGSAAICFGGAPDACAAGLWFPFELEIDATFSHEVGPAAAAFQIWQLGLVADLRANVVNVFGNLEATPEAVLSYSALEEWQFGSQVGETFFFVDGTGEGGGTVRVDRQTLDELEATLVMPAIVLDPGERLTLSFSVYVEADATGPGFRATADLSDAARLRLALPATAIYSTNAPSPPAWITLPEPAAGPVVAIAGLALRFRRRSRRE